MENKRQKKVIKVLGLVGLFLLVFGLSYALFSITLTGKKKTRISTASFKLELLDKNNQSIEKTNNNQYVYEINIENAVPESDEEGMAHEGFIFKLKNSGNIGAKYTIYLDDVELQPGENRLDDQYIKYQLTKNDKTPNPSLLSTLDNRKLDTGIIMNGNTFEYELHIWIDYDAGIEISNKVFESVIRVEAEQYNSKIKLQDGTFAATLVNKDLVDSITKVGAGFDSSQEIEGIYEYTDEEGTSTYAYRGINPNNYVTFAGSTWRVIRIQEDGTVKLIKDNPLNFVSDRVGSSENAYKKIKYNNDYTSSDSNKYAGSNVKAYIEEWYEEEMTSYDNKIATNTYCSDSTTNHNSDFFRMLQSIGAPYSEMFGIFNRLFIDGYSGEGYPSDEQLASMYLKPSLTCRDQDKVNAKVALITADEYVTIGGSIGGCTNYLVRDYNWWTMSLAALVDNAKFAMAVMPSGEIDDEVPTEEKAVHPVITLKANVSTASGNGTVDNPYIIE